MTTMQQIDDAHFYDEGDGIQHPSVTTILQAFQESDFSDWVARKGANAIYDTLKEDPYQNRKDLENIAIEGWRQARSIHGDVGTRVHDLIETGDDLDPLDDQMVRTAMESWHAFRDTASEDDTFEIIDASVPLVGRLPSGFTYGGTLDLLAMVGERRVIIETKTSRELYSKAAIQVTAYALAYEQVTGVKIDAAWGLRLNKYWRAYDLRQAKRDIAVQAFEAAALLYTIAQTPSMIWEL